VCTNLHQALILAGEKGTYAHPVHARPEERIHHMTRLSAPTAGNDRQTDGIAQTAQHPEVESLSCSVAVDESDHEFASPIALRRESGLDREVRQTRAAITVLGYICRDVNCADDALRSESRR
jgi:hypothetical protein